MNKYKQRNFERCTIRRSVCAISMLALFLSGCAESKESIFENAIQNNDSTELAKLFQDGKMDEESQKELASMITEKNNELAAMTVDEFQETPYAFSDELLLTETDFNSSVDKSELVGLAYDYGDQLNQELTDALTINGVIEVADAGLSFAKKAYDTGEYGHAYNIAQSVVSSSGEKIEGSYAYTEAQKILEDAKEKCIVSVGSTLNLDGMDITIQTAELTYRVDPDIKDGFYSYYPADSGEVYLHVKMLVKNTAPQQLDADDIVDATAVYNNDYEYTGFTAVQDENLGFTYSNITSIDPLASKVIDVLISCPQEVADNTSAPLSVTLKFNNQQDIYFITIR